MPRSRSTDALLLLACGLLAGGCGDGADEGRGDAPGVGSVEQWCEVAEEPLPALVFTSAEALDDPDRQHQLELEAVETHLDHYERLAEPPDGVPAGAADRASQLAATFDDMRGQVADGAALAPVVAGLERRGSDESLTGQVSDLADQVDQICR